MNPDSTDNAGVHEDHGALVSEGQDGDDLAISDRLVVAKGLAGVAGVAVGGCNVEGRASETRLQGYDGRLGGIGDHEAEKAGDEEEVGAGGAGWVSVLL